MKIQANTIRSGNILEHLGKQWVVINIQLIQPGKGSAFIAVEMRDIATGIKSNERWRTADSVERLMVDERECTFLFADDDNITFMDSETFEQVALSRDLLGESVSFLQDSMAVKVDFIEGKAVSVALPTTVIMEIIEADPVVKGQTASSSYKPAKLENGMKVMVPPHIEVGTRVVVNTEDCSYVERAKD